KNYADAEKIFEELHRDHPNEMVYAWNLALVLAESLDKEKLRRAAELAEAEVRKNQQQAEGFAVLAWCNLKAGRLDDAEKALAPFAKVAVPSRDAAYFIARVLYEKGKFEDAQKVLKAAEQMRGGYVYRAEAQALLAELDKKVPKKDEKKEDKK